MSRRIITLSAVLAAALAACDGGGVGPAGAGNTSFVLSQGTTSAVMSLVTLDGGDHPYGNTLPLAAIKSIDVRVTGIGALPIGNDSLEDLGWIKLPTPKPEMLNLLALPTAADSGLQVLRGALPAGKYGPLRILFDTATITLKQTVTVGDSAKARTFFADSTYPLYIGGFGMPDSDEDEQHAEAENHFGIVVPAQTFTVSSDTTSTISIVFDPASTVRRVRVTGKGLRLAPVLMAARKDDHDMDQHH